MHWIGRTLFLGLAFRCLLRWPALLCELGLILAPSLALADPPHALPRNASELQTKWQPAIDYDTDSCYAVPAVGPDGTLSRGLVLGGSVTNDCRDEADLDNTNSYARSLCNKSGLCVHVYAFYFEKDQVHDHAKLAHEHDWEHILVVADESKPSEPPLLVGAS